MKNISEEARMHIVAIIASIPRGTLKDFKNSIRELNSEEKKYLKRELSFLVTRGKKEYEAAYNSL